MWAGVLGQESYTSYGDSAKCPGKLRGFELRRPKCKQLENYECGLTVWNALKDTEARDGELCQAVLLRAARACRSESQALGISSGKGRKDPHKRNFKGKIDGA